MTAHPDDNTLALLVDGALDDATRVDVERHLDGCVQCSDLVSELAWVVTPASREAPPGYRFVRALDDKTFEAVELGPADSAKRVAIGVGGPWPALLPAVRHANVATIHAVGTHGGAGFIVHELGTRTFRQWCAETSRTPDAIAHVWCEALRGLAALHAADFVHGQVSPDHVFVEPDGRVFVGAFAREVGRTSGYQAPEQLADKPATQASDQFAACASLWEALAGKKPFTGATAGALAVVMSTPPELPADHRPLFGALARGLAAEPARRWPSVVALADALTRPAARIPWLAIGIAVGATLAGLAFLLR